MRVNFLFPRRFNTSQLTRKLEDNPTPPEEYAWLVLIFTVLLGVIVLGGSILNGGTSIGGLSFLIGCAVYTIGVIEVIMGLAQKNPNALSSSIWYILSAYPMIALPIVIMVIEALRRGVWVFDWIVSRTGIVLLIIVSFNSLVLILIAFFMRDRASKARLLQAYGGCAPLQVYV
jgi:hypothetical protein